MPRPPAAQAAVELPVDLLVPVEKVLLPQVHPAVGAAAHVLPAVPLHVLLGDGVLRGDRDPAVELEERDGLVEAGPRAAAAAEVLPDAGLAVGGAAHVVLAVLQLEHVDVCCFGHAE